MSKYEGSHCFEMNELRALYRILAHEWVSYEDTEAREVVKRIREIIEEYELGSTDSRPA